MDKKLNIRWINIQIEFLICVYNNAVYFKNFRITFIRGQMYLQKTNNL